MNLNQKRKQIFNDVKNYVEVNGWNKEIFLNLKNSNFDYNEIISLFPNGYLSTIQMYLDDINSKMALESKKLNLIQLRLHERVRELCILRLNIMQKEKKFVVKTYNHLCLPQNYKFSSKNLYKTIDQIWFLSGDNSTDFNFYTKRIILAGIYTSTMIHFINNENIDGTIDFLNNQLKKVKYIPKFKNRINDIVKILPQILKYKKKFNEFRQ
tara:strand:- start:18 stop:650 length:633 start_codon:yes stop_codon:yes gene_type:complete